MKNSIRISNAEWEVMNVVWRRAPTPATEVAELLEQKTKWTLTTVRTLLRRLVAKGAVRQQAEGKRYLYAPRVSVEDCVRRESESFLSRVLGRTPPATVLRLVRETDLSKRDIQELRRILRNKEKG